MTDNPTPNTYAEQLAAAQAAREAEREARRAAIAYNAQAPTDYARTDTGEPATA
ncbi:MAG TPA: hypothetical protein VG650_13455 [Mycobacteriales bacterium]|nr:hypothetical protein [Mycobacteriales bacterium]